MGAGNRGILRKADRHAKGDRPTLFVNPQSEGWSYISFAAYHLESGDELADESGAFETALVVLGGTCRVEVNDTVYEHVGARKDVWARTPPYVVLMPANSRYRVTATNPVHLAVAGARLDEGQSGVPVRLITPDEISSEERGEDRTYRYIQHVLPPTAQSARLQLEEVYTPAGNWSSFPPHKHDTEDPPREAYLEEIYYYQLNPKEGFAFQRVYSEDGFLDEAAAPGDGDLIVVPKGYHPVAAMPGYDCYYLNVMAGPTKEWNFTVDPRYAWLMNWKKPEVAGG